MQIFLRILKETGIAVLVLGLVTLTIWLLFQEQFSFIGREIPGPIEYAEVNKDDYSAVDKINAEDYNPTQTYEATTEQLKGFEEERYVSTGLPNPFDSNNAVPDVPTERVTIENSTIGSRPEASVSGEEV